MATKPIALREIQSSTGPRRPLETQRPPTSCRLTIFSLAVIDVLIHLRLAHTAAIRVLRVVTAPRIIALILTVSVACLRSAEVTVELALLLGFAPEINQPRFAGAASWSLAAHPCLVCQVSTARTHLGSLNEFQLWNGLTPCDMFNSVRMPGSTQDRVTAVARTLT